MHLDKPEPSEALPADLMRLEDAAKQLLHGAHVNTLRRWIFAGKVRAWRMGHRYLVSRAAVLAMIEPVEVEQDDTPKPRTLRERRRGHRLATQYLEAKGMA